MLGHLTIAVRCGPVPMKLTKRLSGTFPAKNDAAGEVGRTSEFMPMASGQACVLA
jgi:hypothetical protein